METLRLFVDDDTYSDAMSSSRSSVVQQRKFLAYVEIQFDPLSSLSDVVANRYHFPWNSHETYATRVEVAEMGMEHLRFERLVGLSFDCGLADSIASLPGVEGSENRVLVRHNLAHLVMSRT